VDSQRKIVHREAVDIQTNWNAGLLLPPSAFGGWQRRQSTPHRPYLRHMPKTAKANGDYNVDEQRGSLDV
jgi:hypothetical protein